MDLKAISSFSGSHYGNVESGQILTDVPPALAVHFIENNLCEVHGRGGKETRPLAAGPARQSSASQAAPVSPSSSASMSASAKPPEPAGSSQSTAATSGSRSATPSTGTTGGSGASTTRKRRAKPKK